METSAQPVPAVVTALAEGVESLLGTRLVGVYLGGSTSMGDFVAATSDYDVLIVVEDELTLADLDRLADLHRRLAAEYSDAHRLEGEYAPRRLLIPSGTSVPVPGFDRGHFVPDVREIMLSADNLANMRESGIVVRGLPAAEVLPPIMPDDVRAAVLDMLHEGPGDCTTEQDAAAEVLNLVRSLCALETGRPTTKSQGAAWALAHLDERWQAVVRRADAIRRGAPVADNDARLRTALPEMDRALRPPYSGSPPSPVVQADADADARSGRGDVPPGRA